MVFTIDFDGTLTVESIGDIIDLKKIKRDDYTQMKNEIASFTPKRGIEVLAKYNLRPIIITGRFESLRDVSELWLYNNKVPYSELIMTPDNYFKGEFDWGKYIEFKVEEHLKIMPRFSLDDNKGVITALKQYDIPAFLVEDDFEKIFTLAVNTIMELK
jgi:hypothetical protein